MDSTVIKPRPQAAAVTGWRRTFISLRGRNFRWFWLGSLAAFGAMNMEQVARGWLAYRMTGSALALGIVSAAWGIPTLLVMPFSGVVTDRVNKRNLLMVAKLVTVTANAATTLLVVTGLIEFWHLLVAAVVSATSSAFYMPGRQAFVPDLVEPADLMNAIALNSAGANLTRVVAPALAGALVAVIDVGGVYGIIALLNATAALSVVLIPAELGRPSRRDSSSSVLSDLAEGLGYLRRDRILLTLLLTEMIVVMFAMPYQTLMPVFAVSVLDVGAPGLGTLLSMAGAGALVGSLAIASASNPRRGRLLVGAGTGFGLFLIVFANAGSYVPSLVALLLVGFASTCYMATNNTLLLTLAPPEARGRIMSLYMMTWGMMPFATLPAGALAEAFGAPLTVSLGGTIVVVYCLGLALLSAGVRRL